MFPVCFSILIKRKKEINLVSGGLLTYAKIFDAGRWFVRTLARQMEPVDGH